MGVESYEGKLRVVGTPEVVQATIELDAGDLHIASGDYEIGRWDLHSLDISQEVDGFHIGVEGEELVITLSDSSHFASAVGIGRRTETVKPRRRDRRRPASNRTTVAVQTETRPRAAPRKPSVKPSREPSRVRTALAEATGSARERIAATPLPIRAAIVGGLALVVATVLWPGPVGAVLAIAGMLALVAGVLAVEDDPVIYAALPAQVTEKMLIGGGFAALVLGVALLFLA